MSAEAQVPSNALDYTRTQDFTYTAQGRVLTTTVEPTNAPTCSVTTYSYDAYGDTTATAQANCAGASGNAVFLTRNTGAAYPAVASQGITTGGARLPNATVVIAAGIGASTVQEGSGALLQTVTQQIDPRFGKPTLVQDPNGLSTKVVLDDFGREWLRIAPDGTYVQTKYCYLSGAGTASNTSTCPTPAAGESPTDAVMLVETAPYASNDVKIGPFTRVYSDRLGRPIRSVTQSFDGTSQPAGYVGALVATDTVYNQYGAAYISTAAYFLSSGSATTVGANDVPVMLKQFDRVGRVTAVFKSDPTATGGSATVSVGAFGTRVGAWTTFNYRGVATDTINDKGYIRTEERNAIGLLARVTDDAGGQLAFKYDAFGNTVQSQDAMQNLVTSAYDVRGNKRSTNDPDKGLWTYDYDAVGELVQQQSPNQLALSNYTFTTYDGLGRQKTRTEAEFNTTWTYDTCSTGVGRLCASTTTAGVTKTNVYDSFGRPVNTRVDIASSGKSFASAMAYDATTGRLASVTYPTGLRVAYGYTAGLGYNDSVSLVTPTTGVALAANPVLWRANIVNASLQAAQVTYANSVTERVTFEPGTGRPTDLKAGIGSATNLLNQHIDWDSIGNLAQRIDNNGDGTHPTTEVFLYDNLNRLVQYRVDGAGMSSPYSRTVGMTYDALGMMRYKSDVGNYAYGTMGAAKPHTPTVIAGVSYSSDANGNIVGASSGKYASIGYTSFDLPDSSTGITGPAGSPKYTWQYDERHARVQQTRVSGGNTRSTWYLHPDAMGGLAFESESNSSPASVEHRHFLTAAGQAFGVLTTTDALPTLGTGQMSPPTVTSVTLAKVEYWHKDHLGSIASTSDQNGALQQRYSFDPFGKRRYTTGAYDATGVVQSDWSLAAANGTGRGFTGHEQLDDVGLVHMNGRVYDSTLGLFLQADPHVTNPTDLQNYNRYSYVLNNPLNATDPSGFDDGPATPSLDHVTVTASPQGPADGAGSDPAVCICNAPIVDGARQLNRVTVTAKSLKNTAPNVNSEGSANKPSAGNDDDGNARGRVIQRINRAFEKFQKDPGQAGAMQALLDEYTELTEGDPSSAPNVVRMASAVIHAQITGGEGPQTNALAAAAIASFSLGQGGNGPGGGAAPSGPRGPAPPPATLLYRRGEYDNKALLKGQAKAAKNADNIGIHGVSVSTSPKGNKDGQVVRCATCRSLQEAGFPVHKTGTDPQHYTVELPEPITPDVVRIWNALFK